jgi:CRP-like cAMP-binding protein
MGIQNLISHFNSYLQLTDLEINAVTERASERKIKRRQYILQEGEISRHYNFVVSGCFKLYKIDNNGKEHNLQFAIENNWLSDIGSLHTKKPSKLSIEAIEPSSILQITLDDLVYLYEHFPKFNRIFRVIIENNFIELQNRVLENISNTAEERYRSFLIQYPELSKRLPNTQIASFLGITPEFLSIIRKSIATK